MFLASSNVRTTEHDAQSCRRSRYPQGVPTTVTNIAAALGEAAFRELTRGSIGPELLLRVYQSAFSEAVKRTGYHIDAVATGIVSSFRERAEIAGGDFLESLLASTIGDNPDQQDSRTYQPPMRRSRAKPGN